MKHRTFASLSLALLVTGCLTSVGYNPDGGAAPAPQPSSEGGVAVDTSNNPASADGIEYRDLKTHPGFTTDGLETRATTPYKAANIPGYDGAAKEYVTPNVDPAKPIVILVHGNSSTPADWETFAKDPNQTPMLSERLVAAGYKVYAVDFRYDKVDDPHQNNDTENAGLNFNHGWATPILENMLEAMIKNNPDKKISLVGFSLGSTIIRDALRRLHRRGVKPFEHVKSVVLGSGAHHGVSTFRKLCGPNPTMRGKVACELGDRTSYQPTDFLKPLNGPDGAFETPCADGNTAFGQSGVCGGNKVSYTTIVMKDIKEGSYQDEFVSEGSSALKGANNLKVELTDNDLSGYFYNGLFKNHYGAIRSEAGLKLIMQALGN
jgi:pimeloyl-ACP methyl ester carboxylesterase